jgi:hypothetical protein
MIIIVIVIIATTCPSFYLKFMAWVCKKFEVKMSLRGYSVSMEKLSLETCYRWSLSKISTLVPLMLYDSFKFLSPNIWIRSRMGLHPLIINWLNTWRRLLEILKVTQMLKNSRYYYRVTKRLPLLRILIQMEQFSSFDSFSALPFVLGFQINIFLSTFRNKICANRRKIFWHKCVRFCTYCFIC